MVSLLIVYETEQVKAENWDVQRNREPVKDAWQGLGSICPYFAWL